MKKREYDALLKASLDAARAIYPQFKWDISEAAFGLDEIAVGVHISAVAPLRRADQHRAAYANHEINGWVLDQAKDPVGVMTAKIEQTARTLEAEIAKMRERGWVLDELVKR
jgi:hypothetical protein